MSFKSEQYINAFEFKKSLQDNEETKYLVTLSGKPYKHFFKKTYLNLWENIREDALNYFSVKGIHWHKDTMENNPETIPEGNMLSSQISCVNHLFLLRKNKDYAASVLENVGNIFDKKIISAEIVRDGYGDDGYVEFEAWGTKGNDNPLNEKSAERERGEKSTSVDAVMVGKKDDGNNILILIEWKYTEDYTENYDRKNKCRYVARDDYHNSIYTPLLEHSDCPININNFKKPYLPLYYDPFYQLMRQTLLGWKMAKDYSCDEYIHLHVIPKENKKIQEITSPDLKSLGKDMSSVWKKLLKEPFRYKSLSPEELLLPLYNNQDMKDFFNYLKARYLEKYT